MNNRINSIAAKSQIELDNIPVDFIGYIIIDFGNESVPANVNKEYEYASLLIIRNNYVKVTATNNMEIYDNATVYTYKNCGVCAYGDSIIYAHDNSDIIARGNTIIEAHDNCSVEAFWNARVTAFDESAIVCHDNTEVYLYDKCSIMSYKGTTIHICGNNIVFRNNFQE